MSYPDSEHGQHDWQYTDSDGDKLWADGNGGEEFVSIGINLDWANLPHDVVRSLIEHLSSLVNVESDGTRDVDQSEAGMDVTYHVHLPARGFTGSALPTRASALIVRAALPEPLNAKTVIRRTVITEDVTYD